MNLPDVKASLQAIDNSSLVEKVEEQLVDYLVKNNLKAGDPIPKELELASSLGVSRTVVREAMSRLRMLGLIETKKKKGGVLTTPDLIGTLEKSLIPRIMDEATLRDLFEFRLVLEIGMADLIMARVTADDIQELKKIVEIEPDLSEDLHFNIEHETRFHGKLYEITGNSTLKKFQKLLLPLFDYVHRSGLLGKQVPKTKYVSHKGIVQTIEHGSPEMLRNAMRNHLENHFIRLFP
jgi:DNA-binding FadR family transcriptional regulator